MAMQWKPIETAPKDGSEVVLWIKWKNDEGNGWFSADCVYREGRWHEWGDGGFDAMEYMPLEDWEIPTHWFKIEPPTGGE